MRGLEDFGTAAKESKKGLEKLETFLTAHLHADPCDMLAGDLELCTWEETDDFPSGHGTWETVCARAQGRLHRYSRTGCCRMGTQNERV